MELFNGYLYLGGNIIKRFVDQITRLVPILLKNLNKMFPNNTSAIKYNKFNDLIILNPQGDMNNIKISSYLVIASLLLLVLTMHLAPAALIGLLLFLLCKRLGDWFNQYIPELSARIFAVMLIVTIIVTSITAISITVSNLIGQEQSLSGLSDMLTTTINDLKNDIPNTLIAYVPERWLAYDATSILSIIKEHTNELSMAGSQGLHSIAQILIVIAIALLLTLHRFESIKRNKPFAAELRQRLVLFGKAFENIVFAQIKISAINTLLTGLFLLVVLPYFDIHLPYNKTIVILTFVTGLIPVVGNLISNTLITVISISISFKVAIAALTFLIFIHKLEYFINAKIIGTRINASAWELLLALFVMEACFGITGILLAPIIYAYIKSELTQAKLI